MTVSTQPGFFNGSLYPGERGEQRPSRNPNPPAPNLPVPNLPIEEQGNPPADPWSAATTNGASHSQSWAEPFAPAEASDQPAAPAQVPARRVDQDDHAHSQEHIVYSYEQTGEQTVNDTDTGASPFFYETQPPAPDTSHPSEPATAYSMEDEIRATQEALQRLQALAARATQPGSSEAASDEAASDEAAPSRPVAPLTSDDQLAADPRFVKLTHRMQDGAWPEVLEGLRRLQRELPHSPTLAGLVNEAELKAELVTLWDGKITGRRVGVRTERVLRKSIPFVIVTIIFCTISVFYQLYIAPSREVVAQARNSQQLVDQAHAHFAAGHFLEARNTYDLVLEREPGHAAAIQGRSEAQHQITLAAEYDVAMTVARNGNLNRAVAMLQTLAAKAPHYRDVELQIKQMQSAANASRFFTEAEAAFASGNWIVAVQKYEELLSLDANYQSETLDARLPEAYLRAGQAIIAQQPTEDLGPKQARDYFRKASSTPAFAEQARAEDEIVQTYLRAERFHAQNELSDALNLWLGIYGERPAYLGGYMVEQIYRTAMLLGTQALNSGDREFAEQMFRTAAELQGPDTSDAQRRLQELAAAPPTPTAVAVATPPPARARAPAPVAVAPQPTPSPTPAAGQGWIAFRTNRNGGEDVWVMRSDGSQQQPAPEDIRARLDAMYFEEWTSPDGTKQLVVEKPFGRNDNNIYLKDLLAPDQGWNLLLVDYQMDQYDSVWSPTGENIAFVSNHTENDEIWIMRADGTNHRRLTNNEWAWDKHPSWSPDGTQIAFFSNRTGKRQIWVMDIHGSGQRNLSNNAVEDWDPVWIK